MEVAANHWHPDARRVAVSGLYSHEVLRVLREHYGRTVTSELKILIEYMAENDARYPTRAQFLRIVPDGTFLIETRDHFLVVRDGEIIEDNEVRQMRARVVSVYRIEEGP
jgi:hypothetical protein